MKILLLTPTSANKKSSGGIMLCDLLNLITKDQIFLFAAENSNNNQTQKFLSVKASKFVKRPIETPFSFPNWFFDKPLSSLIEKYKDYYIKRSIIDEAIKFGHFHKVNCVWAILQGKTMIAAASDVAKALKVPLMTQVWDEPEWILNETKISKKVKQNLLKKFDQIIKESIVCATASEIMAKNYQKKYKVKTVTFFGSLSKKLALKPATEIHQDDCFKIGFAGQLYALAEWEALLTTLQQINWQINSRDVKIYFLGKLGSFQIPNKLKDKIVFAGYKDRKQTIKYLAKMDMLYLPYWFDKEHAKIAQTSFPSKLTTYLAAGRPVFFHGPIFASPAKFIKKNSCGILCHSLKTKNILATIGSLINDKRKYQNFTKNGHIAFERFLTYKNLNDQLKQFLIQARK